MDLLHIDSDAADTLRIVHDITRRVVTGGDTEAVEGASRWRREFGVATSIDEAMTSGAADEAVGETISTRRRRQQLEAPRLRSESEVALRPAASALAQVKPPRDPVAAMEARQQSLRAAREERKKLELEHKARQLERRAVAEREARAAREAASAAEVERKRREMAAQIERARRELEAESAEYERELAAQAAMQQEARMQARLESQLDHVRQRRKALQASGGASHGEDGGAGAR
eukprot:6536434-Prymnesium_polylepis.1